MRRTARALTVAALAGVVLGFAASAALGDPAAEVSPGSVAPGGNVTVSVTCDALDADAPATLDATSQAFEEGTVRLKRVSGNDEKAAGPAYEGTARVPPAENFEGDPDAAGPDSTWTVDGTCPAAGGGEGKEWSATFTVARENGSGGGGKGSGEGGSGGAGAAGKGGADGGKDEMGGDQGGSGGGVGGSTEGGGIEEGGTEGGGIEGGGIEGGSRPCTEADSDWTGADESQAHSGKSEGGGTGSDRGTADADKTEPNAEATEPYWEASGLHSGGSDASGKSESPEQDCDSAGAEHGVEAGAGGTFTDSVPALVAGGLLIAGAFGGAMYRLRRKTPTTED
ncbi:hypothetical protein [Streptomyces sp. HD]|uniref:hypothetical protein n=1 Tax=Streptomyces sp. HD TaxID=3020892 RepID=UPI00232CCBA5|nr:hypothetical protein [Streptomyces sp. HD]MDC0766481.1 hypothetical protein [Streptomyces sp. HD]